MNTLLVVIAALVFLMVLAAALWGVGAACAWMRSVGIAWAMIAFHALCFSIEAAYGFLILRNTAIGQAALGGWSPEVRRGLPALDAEAFGAWIGAAVGLVIVEGVRRNWRERMRAKEPHPFAVSKSE